MCGYPKSMSANILKDFLGRRPFEPFRVRLSSGDAYEIRHPENALFLKSGIAIAIPTESGELPLHYFRQNNI